MNEIDQKKKAQEIVHLTAGIYKNIETEIESYLLRVIWKEISKDEYLFDTNILIYHTYGYRPAVDLVLKHIQQGPFISQF